MTVEGGIYPNKNILNDIIQMGGHANGNQTLETSPCLPAHSPTVHPQSLNQPHTPRHNASHYIAHPVREIAPVSLQSLRLKQITTISVRLIAGGGIP